MPESAVNGNRFRGRKHISPVVFRAVAVPRVVEREFIISRRKFHIGTIKKLRRAERNSAVGRNIVQEQINRVRETAVARRMLVEVNNIERKIARMYCDNDFIVFYGRSCYGNAEVYKGNILAVFFVPYCAVVNCYIYGFVSRSESGNKFNCIYRSGGNTRAIAYTCYNGRFFFGD